jgi:hypothetical protein
MLCETCIDCQTRKPMKGYERCQRCLARFNYTNKIGDPSQYVILICETCEMEFVDYKSNQQWEHSFCTTECRVSWVAVHNSISRGGDGVPRTKKEIDAIFYRQNADALRTKARNWYRDNKDKIAAKRRAIKTQVIDAYGGLCACCGESHLEFLTIDHSENDGAAHRKQVGKDRVYKDLIERGFPKDGYQVLCFNCNCARGLYGYCPHVPEQRRAAMTSINGGRTRRVA